MHPLGHSGGIGHRNQETKTVANSVRPFGAPCGNVFGSIWAPFWERWLAKALPKHPKGSPKRPKGSPRAPNAVPRAPQGGPKDSPGGPGRHFDPKWAQVPDRGAQVPDRLLQNTFKNAKNNEHILFLNEHAINTRV